MSVTVCTYEKDYYYPDGDRYRVVGGDWPRLEVIAKKGGVIATHRNWDSVTRTNPVVLPTQQDADPVDAARASFIDAYEDG